MALKRGDIIPNFSLKDQNNEEFDSSSIIGQKPVIIYFYPKNFTPGCTKEACQFRDTYQDFQDYGAEVIGISNDSQKSHQKFAQKHELPFILLSDSQNKVRKKFGVKKSLLGMVPGRETFVVDKNGQLIYRFNSLDASKHMKKALKVIKDL
ncbi:peroxiredoxin [Psychroflexus halocasei]|uniref:thioredoxin-dependent peroxiredoxin n=1 Tax=Psychroflexus halocasei TaxID=908615 RepID=A0A1H3WR81_9FLAO|nr:peroxiredoxin [Psychroflexus halocasei]SDZ89639.1 peroxiredoxin Q/BCP [Psychroflexus halocasei]